MVTTNIWPKLANTEPSYGLPLFHSYDSPCTKTITGNLAWEVDEDDELLLPLLLLPLKEELELPLLLLDEEESLEATAKIKIK